MMSAGVDADDVDKTREATEIAAASPAQNAPVFERRAPLSMMRPPVVISYKLQALAR